MFIFSKIANREQKLLVETMFLICTLQLSAIKI